MGIAKLLTQMHRANVLHIAVVYVLYTVDPSFVLLYLCGLTVQLINCKDQTRGPYTCFVFEWNKISLPLLCCKSRHFKKIFLCLEDFTLHIHLRPKLQVVQYQNSLGDVAKHS